MPLQLKTLPPSLQKVRLNNVSSETAEYEFKVIKLLLEKRKTMASSYCMLPVFQTKYEVYQYRFYLLQPVGSNYYAYFVI